MEDSLTSEDTIDNIDEILEKTESSVCKELEISLIVSIDIIASFEAVWFLLLVSIKTSFSFSLRYLFEIVTLSSSNPNTKQNLILPQGGIFILMEHFTLKKI